MRTIFALAVSVAILMTGAAVPAAAAAQSVHEITANWAGNPTPTSAPFGQPVTAEFHVNTNDATDPYASDSVDNVRVTLTAGNGVFTSIPQVCKTAGVTPVSSIAADGHTMLCNLGSVKEGTASVVQAPVRANSTTGGNLTVSGTATSDSAATMAGPVSPAALPITYAHGMDLSLAQAPGTEGQGRIEVSRVGGNRPFIQMNYSLILSAGSRPGPQSYSFPVTISANVSGATKDLAWEDCVPVGDGSRSTGQPYSDSSKADRTNFPSCSVSGSGTSYTVSLSNLDYTLVHTPTNDSMGQALGGNGVYIASGTVRFSIAAPVTAITTYTFAATPGTFLFADGTSAADAKGDDNTSSATVTPPGNYNDYWAGTPTYSRSVWDANLWVSPGTSADLQIPVPGLTTSGDWNAVLAQSRATGSPKLDLPLHMQSQSWMWNSYQGAGAPQMAGVCTMSQNPVFVIDSMDGGGHSAESGYKTFQSARFFYTTQKLNTKTETCGESAPSSMWIEVTPPAGSTLSDARFASDNLMRLPAGVTAVKMTWNPAVDRYLTGLVRAYGHIDPAAPTSGEGWTVGAFNSPSNATTTWPNYPSLNNWVNISTAPGGTPIPGSTYGPNTNGARDAFRLQGPTGLIEKTVSDTSAQPGVPVTYTLRAEAQNALTSPPPATFSVVDTLPDGMVYVPGSADPVPSSVSANGRTLTWNFTGVSANVFTTIRLQAQRPVGSALAPGTQLTNSATINVVGDNRPAVTPGRTATATVTVPSASATLFGKSADANVLSFAGDSSAWQLTIDSRDPVTNPFTDTIDVLPAVGDGRGTDIDGTYTVTGVTAPTGSTVYYTTSPFGSLSTDPRNASNGGTPGSVTGNTVGWSTTPVAHPTGIRVIAPTLAPGARQTIRIAYTTPAGADCQKPAANDNKPGQVLVNSAGSYAGHTALPMLSSAVTHIGNCYAANLKKYVQGSDGEWHDADTTADYPVFRPGDQVHYRVVITNTGQGTLTGIEVVDDKQPQLGSFTVDQLAPGVSSTHEYTVTLPSDAAGSSVNTATAMVDTPPDVPVAPVIPPDRAGIEIANYSVQKSADPATGTAVKPGQKVTYTITVAQQGTVPASATWQDSLAAVTDDAEYDADASASTGTVTYTNGLLRWDGVLQPGQNATITYSVTVHDAASLGDGILSNAVVSPGCTDGCHTEHPVHFPLRVEKIGESDTGAWTRMDGSTFAVLADDDGHPGSVAASPTQVSRGLFQIDSLTPGSYWLQETAAPAGFSLLAQPVPFTVNANGTATVQAGGDVVTASGDLITVRDVPALNLPIAGGTGTVLYSVAGALLLIAAVTAALMIRRRCARVASDDDSTPLDQ